jgi:hypothetical protein
MTEDEQYKPPLEPEKIEEAQLMAVRTVTFGTGLAGDMRLGYVQSSCIFLSISLKYAPIRYKYQPFVLKDILFPLPATPTPDRPPPRKRRRTTIGSEDIIMDVDPTEEPPAPTPNRPVILETPKETYMLSLTHGSEFSPEGRKYDISLILEGEVEEDREDAVVLLVADKNAVKAAQETPPPSPPADNESSEPNTVPAPSSNANTGSASKSTGVETQRAQDATTPSSRPPSPSPAAPRTNVQSTNVDSAKAAATSPPRSSEEVALASKTTAQKSQPPAKPVKKTAFKHPVAQVLQRRVGEDMFKFLEEGISIADGEDGLTNEWLVQVKSWKWATRKVVRV